VVQEMRYSGVLDIVTMLINLDSNKWCLYMADN